MAPLWEEWMPNDQTAIFTETWTVEYPRSGQEHRIGPTVKRQVLGTGYQPAVGGSGGNGYHGRAPQVTDGRAALEYLNRERPTVTVPEAPTMPVLSEGQVRMASLREEIHVLQLQASVKIAAVL